MKTALFPNEFAMHIQLAKGETMVNSQVIKVSYLGFLRAIPSWEYTNASLKHQWLDRQKATLANLFLSLPDGSYPGGYIELYDVRDIIGDQILSVFRFPVLSQQQKLKCPQSFYMKALWEINGQEFPLLYNSTLRGEDFFVGGKSSVYTYYGDCERYSKPQQAEELMIQLEHYKERVTKILTKIPKDRAVDYTMELIEFQDIESQDTLMLYRIPTYAS